MKLITLSKELQKNDKKLKSNPNSGNDTFISNYKPIKISYYDKFIHYLVLINN